MAGTRDANGVQPEYFIVEKDLSRSKASKALIKSNDVNYSHIGAKTPQVRTFAADQVFVLTQPIIETIAGK